MSELESSPKKEGAKNDSWQGLKNWTDARIALGRCGTALPIASVLDFQLDHARACDAVGLACSFESLENWLGLQNITCLSVQSRAATREEYLRRPDLGRLLSHRDEALLREYRTDAISGGIGIVVADGLSASAIERQAIPFLSALLPMLPEYAQPCKPIVLAHQARVALSDEIGSELGLSAILMLVGERPGLSSPDSMGLYLTWSPRRGRQNADRNCISNIRPGGLDFVKAARRCTALITGMYKNQVSGIALKEESLLE